MDFSARLDSFAKRVPDQKAHVNTEEAVKTALILPLLQVLGYDVFNPTEVIPEFTADVGIKKGEKVDYAVSVDGSLRLLIEAKPIGAKLETKHISQLYRYFSASDARVAVLTDGLRYLFYADTEKANQMDSRPFFVFDLEAYTDQEASELAKFSKDSFDLETILGTANDLIYLNSIIKEITQEFSDSPSDELVRLFASRVYDGRLTASVIQQFSELVPRAFDNFLRNQIKSKLDTAFAPPEQTKVTEQVENKSDIVTTDEELDGFRIVQAIVSEVTSPDRVHIRDAKSYCAVLLDDNNRKGVVRLHFNTRQKYLEVMDEEGGRSPIEGLTDIFSFKNRIQALVSALDS